MVSESSKKYNSESRPNPPVIKNEEVNALLNYTLNKGISVDTEVLDILYRELSSDKSESVVKVHTAYSKLCKTSKPVTGHTIVASNSVKKHAWPVVVLSIVFFFLAMSNEIMSMMFDDGITAEGSASYGLMNFQIYVLDKLAPVLWGGLGSCVYLMKLYSDLAKDKIFEPEKIGGWGSRVVLGAILGGVIQYIFSPDFLTSSGIDDYALAFLVGLSVKVVYGALEKTIEAIAEKMNLDSIKNNSNDKKTLKELKIRTTTDESPDK
jgi:hypothetical protein